MISAAFSSKSTVLDLADALMAGRTTSRDLVEAALARIADPTGEGARTFVKVYADSARAAADAQDQLRGAGYVGSPLAGLPVSVKDLFDVAGAFGGIAGFKPTQHRIPRDGAVPLSTTLDSIGPLANSIACCAIADAVMAGEPAVAPAPIPVEAMRLGVPQSYVLDDLAPEVANAFAAACTAL